VHDVGQLIVRFLSDGLRYPPVEARIGVLAVLHTWSQNQGTSSVPALSRSPSDCGPGV
jgi:hypothetical protein